MRGVRFQADVGFGGSCERQWDAVWTVVRVAVEAEAEKEYFKYDAPARLAYQYTKPISGAERP